MEHLVEVPKLHPWNTDGVIHDLEAKLAALEYEPSSIELSMSPQQLYEIGSPLWTRGLPLRKVFNILTDAEYAWGYDEIPDEDYE